MADIRFVHDFNRINDLTEKESGFFIIQPFPIDDVIKDFSSFRVNHYKKNRSELFDFLNLLKGVINERDFVDENLEICGFLIRFEITTNVSSFL